MGTWYYDWEQIIPFVPAMIIPYMSIDLFFVAAPFLCRDRAELRILSRRILLAILLAGGCFLLFPLQLAVERPPVSGMMGELFNSFRQFDLPYNLCPSLHIALRTILAVHYARHTHGTVRWASNFWFSLIGLSTLLTYQHHVVDVAGGFVLAIICFYLIRETPFRLPVEHNVVDWTAVCVRGSRCWRLSESGSAHGGCGCCGRRFRRDWSPQHILVWGRGFSANGAGGCRGVRRLVLAPMLIGQLLSWHHYRRQCRPWDAVTDRLWIGRRLTDQEADEAIQEGVTAVVDLTVAFPKRPAFEGRIILPYPYLI